MSIRNRMHETSNVAEKRKQLMQDIERDYEENGEYILSQVTLRNIMLVGRTRTGKSTIKSLLINPTTVPEDLKLFSSTKSPTLESYHITGKNIILNIVDTPGLLERGTNQFEARDNDNILKSIDAYINREFSKFHVICFCVAITCGINDQDVQVLRLLLEMFGDSVSNNSCLIVTHCESKDEKERNEIKEELWADKYFKEIFGFFKLGIFFSGALDRDNYNMGSDNLIDQFITISDYRTKLIEMFTNDIEPFSLDTTRFSELKRLRENKLLKEKEIDQAQRDLEQKANELEKIKDELKKTKAELKRMQSNAAEHLRIVATLRSELDGEKKIQAETQETLNSEKIQRQHVEEALKFEQKNQRKVEKKLELERGNFNQIAMNLKQEQEVHYLTQQKLQQETDARLLAEKNYSEKLQKLDEQLTALYKDYDREVQKLRQETQLREKAERERDEADDRLKESKSFRPFPKN